MVRLTREGGIIVTENIWDEETALQLVGEEGFKHIGNYVSLTFSDQRIFSTILNDSMIISYKNNRSPARPSQSPSF